MWNYLNSGDLEMAGSGLTAFRVALYRPRPRTLWSLRHGRVPMGACWQRRLDELNERARNLSPSPDEQAEIDRLTRLMKKRSR